MEAVNQRLLYIDYIKTLGIILVILYHCQYVPLNSMLIQGAYAICVPLFFMVNGYLMLRKQHSIKLLLKKDLKILVVLFVWAFISTGVSMELSGEWKSVYDSWKSFFANSLFIGQYSLAIYVMQTPICRIIQSVLPISTWSAQRHINGALLPVLTLIICVLLTRLMQTNRITNYLITI